MDFIIDDPKQDQEFRQILTKIRLAKSGETVEQMKQLGLTYKISWGASIVSLREIAKQYQPNHLLALKLWNKQWRETMILASMLDDPAEVTEEQMDYWTKSVETAEIAEVLNTYLWCKTKFAFVKSLEWCLGKKHLVRFAGLNLMGRLAIAEKSEMDELFEPFFDVLSPLSKDPKLKQVFYRSFILLGMKSKSMNEMAILFAEGMKEFDSEDSSSLAEMILTELTSEYVQESFVKNT
ncbi:MAG: hypothetical protein Q8S54_17895 [Bacteroidota bacterium]|nr:hypothetical protein [Odoribacter sp.]MDP3645042.1 hypothetical protein [Bacteroidota bacterium]